MQMLISLTIKRREKENQKSQSESRHSPSQIWTLDCPDLVFKPQCGSGEIYGTCRAEQTENQIERNVVHGEFRYRAFEGRLVAEEDI